MASVFLISFLIFILDQSTKYWVQLFLTSRTTTPVFKNIFRLTLVHNQGAAFGFFQGGVFLFILTSLACIIVIFLSVKNNALFYKFFGLKTQDRWAHLALGFILGGACGNLLDRVRFSYVVDFLDFRIWPVFNVADSAITIGGILLFLRILKANRRKDHAPPSL
jgi:signal peptidase II